MTTRECYDYGEGFQTKSIALCLRDPEFLPRYSDVVRPEWYEQAMLSTLAYVMNDYWTKHHKTPTKDAMVAASSEYARMYGGDKATELRSELVGWIEYIYKSDLSDADFIKDIMVKFGQRQAVKRAIGRGVEMLEQNAELEDLREILDEALRVGSVRNFGFHFGAEARNLQTILQEDAIYGAKNKVPTGLTELDKRLHGGLGAGEIMTVVGPAGKGKSTAMVSMGRAAMQHFAMTRQNKTVIHVTLELKEIDVGLMYGACLTGVSRDRIQEGDKEYPQVIDRVLNTMSPDPLRIRYFSPRSISSDGIRWLLANMQSVEGVDPGLLIVDYADKLKGADGWQEVGRVYEDLVGIGDKFGIPVITGSQVNREWSYEELIDNRGVATSWAKVEVSDVVAILCQSQEEHQLGVIRYFFSKVRRGRDQGQLLCNWSGERAYIWEMTQDEVDHFEERKAALKASGKVTKTKRPREKQKAGA